MLRFVFTACENFEELIKFDFKNSTVNRSYSPPVDGTSQLLYIMNEAMEE